mgnify:CR=1 FL=1
MADLKITQLTENTTPITTDILPMVDDPAGTAITKKVTIANLKTGLALVKGDVGLGSVDNTADTAKPVSTAQQTALDLKSPIASPTFTGTVSGVTAAMVGSPSGSGNSSGTNTGDQTLPTDATIVTTDVTTNNVSITKHGFTPKAPNNTTDFLRADATWATPPAASYTLVATLASDQATGANTTPVSLTGLVFTYAANSTYRIWFMGAVSSAAATTGAGFQFDLSSAVTSINVSFFHQLANTGTLSGGHSIADDASVGVSSAMPGTSVYPVRGEGILITTGNTGTAQLRFRSETTAVTTAKAGLTMVVEKII